MSKSTTAEELVGFKLHEMRIKRNLSLRALAERSGLNVNTLCLIENGKSSPSVSTLQQLALGLNVPISAFFESEPVQKQVVFTPVDQRPQADFGGTQMQNLAKGLAGNIVQPFTVTLTPGSGSGGHKIVHTGYEFVYCLSGTLAYEIEEHKYALSAGDSLVFKAHLPHCWENDNQDIAQILLVLFSPDGQEEPSEWHFSIDNKKRR